MLTDISIDTQNFDISMGTGFVRFVPGGGIVGNVFLNGNVGIGKTNPTAALDVNGTMRTNLIDTQNFDISMGTGFLRVGGGGEIAGNVFLNGNVGIGTTDTAATLDVSGAIRARREIQFGADNAFQIRRSTEGGKALLIEHYSGPSANVCFINNFTGRQTNVGIDTTAPIYPLDVSGICRIGDRLEIRAENEPTFRSAYIQSTLTDLYILNQKAGPLRFGTNNAEDMRIDINGNVGIGTTNPTSALDVNGTMSTTSLIINSTTFNYVPWTAILNGTGGNSLINVLTSGGSSTITYNTTTATRAVYMYSVVGKILYMSWTYRVGTGPATGGPITSYFYKLPSGYTTSSISNLVVSYINSNGSGTLIGTGQANHNTASFSYFIFYTTSGTTPHLYFVGKPSSTSYSIQGDGYVPYTATSLNLSFEAAIPLA